MYFSVVEYWPEDRMSRHDFLYIYLDNNLHSPAFVFDPCSSTVRVSITNKASCFWSSNELFLESTIKKIKESKVIENITLFKDAS